MQISLCLNASTAPRYAAGVGRSEQDRWPPTSSVVPEGQPPPDAPATGELTIAQESLTDDVQELPAPDPLLFGTYDGSKGPGKPGNAGGAYAQGAQNLVSKAKEKLTPGE